MVGVFPFPYSFSNTRRSARKSPLCLRLSDTTKTQSDDDNSYNTIMLLNQTGLPLAAGTLVLSVTADSGQGPIPGICSRACWAARAPTCGISQMSSLTHAIIHHTAGASDYSTDLNTSKARV